jgi:hypothetical protein
MATQHQIFADCGDPAGHRSRRAINGAFRDVADAFRRRLPRDEQLSCTFGKRQTKRQPRHPICGTAANDVWAVGADSGDGPLVPHWEGAA